MEIIRVTVVHFYNHLILYPFMSQVILDALEDAYLHDRDKAIIPKAEFDHMIKEYFDTLKN